MSAIDAGAQVPVDARVETDTRIAVLDAMRGLAALAVAMFHFYGANQFVPRSDPLAEVMRWGWLGVPVFFVISGYVIPYSAFSSRARGIGPALRFLARRWIRVGLPLVAAAAFTWVAWWASWRFWPSFAGQVPTPVTAKMVGCHAAMICGLAGESWLSPVFWTLQLELQFYLLVGLALACRDRVRPALIVAGAAALVALGWFVSREWVFAWLPLFALGAFAWHARGGVATMTYLASVALIGVLVWLSLGLAEAITGVLATAVIARPPRRLPRALLLLGTVSYSLYLTHVVLGGRVVNLLSPSCGMACGGVGAAATAALAMGVALMGAWIFWWLIEHPATALSQQVRKA